MNKFKSPLEAKITSRISTITNVYVNSIIPNIKPSLEEINSVYEILGLDVNNLKCSYCRVNNCSEWDHFRPTVKDKKSTGYLADIYNLVPSCGKCNQSKRAEHWKSWILSSVQHSPKSRGVKNLDDIVSKLDTFEEWSDKKVTRIDYAKLDNETTVLLEKHQINYERVVQLLRESQELAVDIKGKIKIQLNL